MSSLPCLDWNEQFDLLQPHIGGRGGFVCLPAKPHCAPGGFLDELKCRLLQASSAAYLRVNPRVDAGTHVIEEIIASLNEKLGFPATEPPAPTTKVASDNEVGHDMGSVVSQVVNIGDRPQIGASTRELVNRIRASLDGKRVVLQLHDWHDAPPAVTTWLWSQLLDEEWRHDWVTRGLVVLCTCHECDPCPHRAHGAPQPRLVRLPAQWVGADRECVLDQLTQWFMQTKGDEKATARVRAETVMDGSAGVPSGVINSAAQVGAEW
ncbi:MAG: hypothetical protein KKI08_10950 [Armatimonadetes bacterium]|nr:hypothetical protein [Armatimonadota bacterium]